MQFDIRSFDSKPIKLESINSVVKFLDLFTICGVTLTFVIIVFQNIQKVSNFFYLCFSFVSLAIEN